MKEKLVFIILLMLYIYLNFIGNKGNGCIMLCWVSSKNVKKWNKPLFVLILRFLVSKSSHFKLSWWDYLGRVELFVILICNKMLWHYCKMDWFTSQMVSEIYPKNWMMLSNGVHNAIQYIQCCTQSIPSVIRSLGSFIKIYLWFFQGCETLKMLLMEVTM